MCGEQNDRNRLTDPNHGSSPRVRGTVHRRLPLRLRGRIIPACAGNRIDPVFDAFDTADHPRVCGEQDAVLLVEERDAGSSPRVRGTVTVNMLLACLVRIIPACAGNSTAQVRTSQVRADHPRVCGEQEIKAHITEAPNGSSPRVRGTVAIFGDVARETRIIPACAGNRGRTNSETLSQTDHPRVCGEQASGRLKAWNGIGSSPRVRGTELQDAIVTRYGRIIPACAGNRRNWSRTAPATPDHPRVCGEQVSAH